MINNERQRDVQNKLWGKETDMGRKKNSFLKEIPETKKPKTAYISYKSSTVTTEQQCGPNCKKNNFVYRRILKV